MAQPEIVYDESSIKDLDQIEHIRLRPTGYIINTSVEGIFHITKEIVDNATDELEALGGIGHQLNVFIFRSPDRRSCQICIQDTGRGVPVGKLIASFSKGNTSGKFDTKVYKNSTGLFGIGSKVTMSLSDWFRAISYNGDIIGDAYMRYDDIPKKPIISKNNIGLSGTTVMFEPDPAIFSNIPDFVADYSVVSNYLMQLGLYAKYRCRLYVIDMSMPTDLTQGNAKIVAKYLQGITHTVPTYDSDQLSFDQYIDNFFNTGKKWDLNYQLQASSDNLDVDMTLKIAKLINVPNNTKLTFVNSIMFTNDGSYHISMFYSHIRKALVGRAPDKDIKAFIKTSYSIPIWLVMNVKFTGAQFVSMAKTSFEDINFKAPYTRMLNQMLSSEFLDGLYDQLQDHIVAAYNRFNNKSLKVSNMRHLLSHLNRPQKFNNCRTTNRDEAELFLVEGDSAKPDQGRDSRFQATYVLGGKPFNALSSFDNFDDARRALVKNHIFSDIVKILNVTPGSNDLSKVNFGKIFIMTDADTHGYHIRNILLEGMYLLSPALIEEGFVHIVLPPLYNLNIKGNKDTIYIKDEREYDVLMSYHVYWRCVEITVESDTYKKTLTRDEMVAFAEIVTKVGSMIERIATEYCIPSIILEHLSLMTAHIKGIPDTKFVAEWLGCEVKYIEVSNVMILSIGAEDIVVPLTQITNTIYEKILPMYREFYYGKTRIRATTKRSGFLKDQLVTITQLYQMFKELRGVFHVDRNKGLGSMDPADRSESCITPDTRRMFGVATIGDINKIRSCLGKETKYRKEIVRR